jgi:hypothetical protein
VQLTLSQFWEDALREATKDVIEPSEKAPSQEIMMIAGPDHSVGIAAQIPELSDIEQTEEIAESYNVRVGEFNDSTVGSIRLFLT